MKKTTVETIMIKKTKRTAKPRVSKEHMQEDIINYETKQREYLRQVLEALDYSLYGPAKIVWEAAAKDLRTNAKRHAVAMHELLLHYRTLTAQKQVDVYALKGSDIWLVVNSVLVSLGQYGGRARSLQEQLIHDESLKSRILFPDETARILQLQLYSKANAPILPMTEKEILFFQKNVYKVVTRLLSPVAPKIVEDIVKSRDIVLFVSAWRAIVAAELIPLMDWDSDKEEVVMKQANVRLGKVGYVTLKLFLYLYATYLLGTYNLVQKIEKENSQLLEQIFDPKKLLEETKKLVIEKLVIEKANEKANKKTIKAIEAAITALDQLLTIYEEELNTVNLLDKNPLSSKEVLMRTGHEITEVFRDYSFKKETKKVFGKDNMHYTVSKYNPIVAIQNELLLQDVTIFGSFPMVSCAGNNYHFVTKTIHGGTFVTAPGQDERKLEKLSVLQVNPSILDHFLESNNLFETIISLVEDGITHAQRRQFLALIYHLNFIKPTDPSDEFLISAPLNFDFRGRMYFRFPASPHFSKLSRMLFTSGTVDPKCPGWEGQLSGNPEVEKCIPPFETIKCYTEAWYGTLLGAPKACNSFEGRQHYWTQHKHSQLKNIMNLNQLHYSFIDRLSPYESIGLDATSSGPQCIGYLFGDISLLEATNLASLEQGELTKLHAKDLYGIITIKIKELYEKEAISVSTERLKAFYQPDDVKRLANDDEAFESSKGIEDKKGRFRDAKNEMSDVVKAILTALINSTCFNRNIVKMLLVPEVYGKTPPVSKKDLLTDFFNKNERITINQEEFILNNFSKQLKFLVADALFTIYTKQRNDLFPTLEEYSKLAHYIAVNIKDEWLEWTMPDGLKIQNKYYKLTEKQFKVRGTGCNNRTSIRLKQYCVNKAGIKITDRVRLARSFGANFIHSMDAYVARQVMTDLRERFGHSVLTVHDCFIINPALAEQLYESYFFALTEATAHAQNQLLKLLAQAQAQNQLKGKRVLNENMKEIIRKFESKCHSPPQEIFKTPWANGLFLFF